MKSLLVQISLFSSLFGFSSCSSSQEFFSDPSKFSDGQKITVHGIFDLKVICLNANRDNVITDNFCLGYFSETAEPNARSVQIELTICSEEINTDCIERLPDNAPPEVIVVKDHGGSPIANWNQNKVVLIPKTHNSKRRFEVIQID